ncbi:MAG: DnaJ domain-containing protein, partial [Pseudomonadota bacterium]
LLGLLLLAIVIMTVHGFKSANPSRLAGQLQFAGGLLCLGLAVIALARGVVQVAMPLAAFGGYLLYASRSRSSRPIGGPLGGAGGNGSTSQITTEFLEMELDHGSGEIRGVVLKGLFEGRRIEALQPAELALLWQDVRADDAQSAQLIEAYLDNRYPSWREDIQRGEQDMRGPDGRMTREEAFEILGLLEGADADDIRRAHRELMLKFHPDRGGSTYLASKINEAKDVLLGA